ncbi:MAG: NAD(P)H-quinone oxidoreductase [Acidobacteriaceae bacterium]|nr:NAD(P)H-quinone oxidoreductase [Acidobacteriaceae bacterium]MBV9781042.1 NAD(P)H-quinone oxidoreductase [Acidobacteriaceae bacterium]
MIAIEISSFGPPDVLRPVERPKPVLNENEALVHIEAAGVARADILQRQGKYPPPPGASDIPGLDVAGTIEEIGDGVHNWNIGDRVCAILAGGGYAEFCAVPAAQVLPIPDGWSAPEATTLPENIFTVYDNLVIRAGLKRGETVLIHGGTSGVGSMAIMLSRACSARPIVTAGSREKCDAALRFGAEYAINYKEQDFVAETLRITEGRGANVVLDIVGGPYLERNVEVLAVEGRLSIVSTQGGRTGQLEIGKLMGKRGRVLASTLRARTPEEKGEIARRLRRDIWPILAAKNVIRPIIDSTFPLRDARMAHERMEGGKHMGKIVLLT